MHNEIKSSHNIKDGTIVYRGINYFKFSPEIGIGSKFYLRKIISASLKKEIAERFCRGQNYTIMEITILNNGTNGYQNYCYAVKEISPFPNQEEVIITSHCSYIVTDINHTDNKDCVSLICEGFLFN